MKIRFIEESVQSNVLMETENTEILNTIGIPYTQIYITKENEVLICEYNYNVLKVLENEIDIFVTIIDITDLLSKKTKNKIVKKVLKKDLFDMLG
jgi:hypothetical protein